MAFLMFVLLLPMPEKYSVPWSKTFYIPSFRKNCPVPEERHFKLPSAGKGWSLERAPPLRNFFVGKFQYTTWKFLRLKKLCFWGCLNLAPHGRNFFPGLRIRINLSCWIRIRIRSADLDPDPGGQKWPTKTEKDKYPQKQKKVQNFHVLKCWMFSVECWRLLL